MTDPRPLRVLQVVDSLGMGGAETWLMELLRRWSRSGEVRMDFLLTGGQPSLFDAEAAALGAKLHYLRFGRRTLPNFVRGFRRLLSECRYDAIHDHSDYISGWHFLLGAGLLPPARVAHVHNPWLHITANYAVSRSRRWSARIGKRLVERLASDVCGTSAEILRAYGFPPGNAEDRRVSVVHCGFDTQRFAGLRKPDRNRVLSEFGWPTNSRLILYAGRLDRALAFDDPQNHKNSWLALNIARAAIQRDPNLRMIMAGEGASRPRLQRQVNAWGMSNAIRLPGVRHDMPALMRAADVLLFPSAQEGLGMAAVEAQAAGLPVLASDAVPREAIAIPELFHTCALSEPVERWAEMLLTLSAASRLAPPVVAARLAASPFSIEVSAARLIEVYRAQRC